MQDGASWEPVGLEGEVRSEALSLSGETKYMIEVYDYHCHFLWNDRASHAAPGPTSSEDMLFLLDLPSLPTSHYQLFPLYTGCCWVPCRSLLPSPSSWTEPWLGRCLHPSTWTAILPIPMRYPISSWITPFLSLVTGWKRACEPALVWGKPCWGQGWRGGWVVLVIASSLLKKHTHTREIVFPSPIHS